jgi:DNA invertase Pin-like site-specific DNA recombinase
MRAAIYLRVSTNGQTTDTQERELRAAAKRMGHAIVKIYSDNGISGSKGRNRRSTSCIAMLRAASSIS